MVRLMVTRLARYLYQVRALQRINMALTRGAVGAATRVLDPVDPRSWVFCGFSQNGEDGILDVLTRRLLSSNRYFLEIGASDGLENNTTWLALVRRFGGLMIEKDRTLSDRARLLLAPLNPGLDTLCCAVTVEDAAALCTRLPHPDPDVFSLDIDGVDYYIAERLLASGLRPKICVVEYNSAFGPELRATIPYDAQFSARNGHGQSLYFGCSIGGWRRLFESRGYRFLTVEPNGVNAFFIDPSAFPPAFTEGIRGVPFADSCSHVREYRGTWRDHLELLRSSPLAVLD